MAQIRMVGPSFNKSHLLDALAFILGLCYVAARAFKIILPDFAVPAIASLSVLLIGLWLFINRSSINRPRIAIFLSRLWPLLLSLLWIRDTLSQPGRTLFTDLLVSAIICSLSLRFALFVVSIRNRLPKLTKHDRIAWILAALYTIVFTIMPGLRYWSYRSFWMDLGYMIHPIWNTAHGRLFEYMQLDGTLGSSLGNHFALLFLAIAPAFRCIPHAETLFFIQAAGFAAAGLLFFKWAKSSTGSPNIALLLQAAFYLWFPLQFAAIIDFHEEPLAVPLIMLMLWGYDQDRKPAFWLGLLLSVLSKEHMGFMLAPVLLVLALGNRWRPQIIGACLLCIVYSVLAQSVFMPLFNQGSESLATAQIYPGGTTGLKGIIAIMLADPGSAFFRVISAWNIEQLCWVFGSLLFIPLLVWPAAVALSGMLFKEMYGAFTMQNHHQSIMAPVLFWCVLLFIRKLDRPGQRVAAAAVLSAALLFGAIGGDSPLSIRFWKTFKSNYALNSHSAACAEAVKMIPKNAPVSASSNIAVHFCDRRCIYLFPRPFLDKNNVPCWETGVPEPFENTPDWVVFDTKQNEIGHEIRLYARGNRGDDEVRKLLADLGSTGGYREVFNKNGVVVLKKQ